MANKQGKPLYDLKLNGILLVANCFIYLLLGFLVLVFLFANYFDFV